MEYLSLCILIVTSMVATVLISSSTGTTITAVPDDNKVIQWTMNPLPLHTVTVLHPSGGVLYSALGTTVIPVSTDLGKRVSNTGSTNTVTGHIEFTLSDVTVDDAGDYRTKYISNREEFPIAPRDVTLVVYAKPLTPNITVLSPPVVGSDLFISCVTQSNSKPDNHTSLQMTYIWYRNGTDLPSNDRYVTSGSQLEVKNIQRTDRDTVFTCKAYETVSLTSNVSAGYTVVIQYGPGIVSIDSENGLYSIVEKTGTLGPITCRADCVPVCNYTWKFNGTNHGRSSDTLTIINIQRTSAGAYWCVASNFYGVETSKDVRVTVVYGPEMTTLIPSNSSYTRVEVTNNTLGPITCTADCNPECTYEWFQDGKEIRNSAVLTLTGITRSDRGTYLCRAYNDHGGMNSTSFDLFVKYGAGLIVLLPKTTSYTLLEDSSLNEITCTSSCNPPCSHRWERDSNQVSNGQVLGRINNIKRSQAGQYVCKVTSIHGNRESSVVVLVQYAPDKPVLSLNSNTTDVRENSQISVRCTTQSVPPSTMKIYRENLSTLTTKADTISINHNIPKANCLDTGLFYCSAENIIGKSTTAGENVNVLCKPRPDHRAPQVLKQALGSDESLNISVTLISNPLPTIYWSLRLDGSETNMTNNTDNFVFHNIQKSLTVSSRAVRTNMGEEDFGVYVLHAYNDYGQSTVVFTVIQRNDNVTPPEYQTCEYVYRVALLVTGLVTIFVGITLITWWRCRQTRVQNKFVCSKCGIQKLNSNTSSDSAHTSEDRNSQHYEDVGQLPASGQVLEMTMSRDGAYEGLGERSMPSVYGRLNRNRTRRDRPEDQYVNTRFN